MAQTKSKSSQRLLMAAGTLLVAAMLAGAIFPDFFRGLMDGLKG